MEKQYKQWSPVTKNDDLKFNLKFKYQNLLLASECSKGSSLNQKCSS